MGLLGRSHSGESRIVRDAVAVEKAEEAPYSGEGAGEGCGVKAVGTAAGKIATEVGGTKGGEVGKRGGPAQVLGEEGKKA